MRRARLISAVFVLLLVALPTSAALAAEPNAVDDPAAIFNDDVAVAGIADATMEDAPAVVAAPASAAIVASAAASAPATRAPAAPNYRASGTQQLPFTGIDSGLIPLMSLVGSLLLIGGGLLYVAAESTRREALISS